MTEDEYNKDEYVIVGKKDVQVYVLTAMKILNNKKYEYIIYRACGNNISTAVIAAHVLCVRYMSEYEISNIVVNESDCIFIEITISKKLSSAYNR